MDANRATNGEGHAWERPPAYDCDHASCDGLAGTDLLVCMACFRLVLSQRDGQFTRYIALDDEPIKTVFREVERLRKVEEVARKLVYVAAPPVSPVRLALGLPALCEVLGIDPIEATEKATADEEAAKKRAAERAT